jgi:hypothetical protein
MKMQVLPSSLALGGSGKANAMDQLQELILAMMRMLRRRGSLWGWS